MNRETELSLIRQIIGLAEQKTTHLDAGVTHSPIARYACPDRFDRERVKLLKKHPVIVAHASELDGENTFVTRRFLDLPLLLTRDPKGEARAFLNVCRHRGAQIEREASGCKRVFTCPYHAWSWDNKGALRAVPQEDPGFPDLPRTDRALRQLQVAEAHGFLWVIADPDHQTRPDLAKWLGGLAEDFAWLGMKGLRVANMREKTVHANWKTLFEGGLEAYHFRVAHKATIAPYFPDNLSSYQMFGPHTRIVLPRVSMQDLRGVPEAQWSIRRDANLLYSLTPTSQLLVQQDHVMWMHYEPLAVDRTKVRVATLAPCSADDTPEMQAHWDKNLHITWTALMEDFDLGEEIQSGFASRGNPSHLFGRFEGALNGFNIAVEELISG